MLTKRALSRSVCIDARLATIAGGFQVNDRFRECRAMLPKTPAVQRATRYPKTSRVCLGRKIAVALRPLPDRLGRGFWRVQLLSGAFL
jgi:hypothetical protein